MAYANIQKTLEDKLAELMERAVEIEDKLSDPGEQDWEENALEMEDDEVRIKIGELAKKEIEEIESVLSRIKSGEYGKCTICRKPIDVARLELLPHTLTCINCA